MRDEIADAEVVDRQPRNWLAPIDETRRPPVKWGDQSNIDLCTLDRSTEAGRVQLSRALRPPDMTLADLAGQVVEFTDVVIFFGPILHESTGELVWTWNPRLVLVDGRIAGWCSEVTTDSFNRGVLSLIGPGPWHPPARVKFVAHKGKAAGHWYHVELAAGVDEKEVS